MIGGGLFAGQRDRLAALAACRTRKGVERREEAVVARDLGVADAGFEPTRRERVDRAAVARIIALQPRGGHAVGRIARRIDDAPAIGRNAQPARRRPAQEIFGVDRPAIVVVQVAPLGQRREEDPQPRWTVRDLVEIGGGACCIRWRRCPLGRSRRRARGDADRACGDRDQNRPVHSSTPRPRIDPAVLASASPQFNEHIAHETLRK